MSSAQRRRAPDQGGGDRATGLACSIGIGPNKLVAKVASDADKPDGFLMLTTRAGARAVRRLPPLLIPGIGPKTAAKLEQRGITRLDQLAALPDHTLSEWFGTRLGPHLGALARFEDERTLEIDRVRKSESRRRPSTPTCAAWPRWSRCWPTWPPALRGPPEATGAAGGPWASRCAPTTSRSTRGRARCPLRVSTLDVLWPVALDLLRTLDPARPVRLLGVRVAGMEDGAAHPPGAPSPASSS